MFKITHSSLANPRFVAAIQKLAQTPFPIKLTYDIKRLVDKITIARREVATEYEKEVLPKFSTEKDEHGQPKIEEAKQDDFMKAQDEFGLKEKTIDRNKLAVSILVNAGYSLSASDLTALDGILEYDIADEAPAVSA
jgi:hypothetical protein